MPKDISQIAIYTDSINGQKLINEPIKLLIKQGQLESNFRQIFKHLSWFRRCQIKGISLNDYLNSYIHILDIHELLEVVKNPHLQYQICHNYAHLDKKFEDLRQSLYETIDSQSSFKAQIIKQREITYLEVMEDSLKILDWQNVYKKDGQDKVVEETLIDLLRLFRKSTVKKCSEFESKEKSFNEIEILTSERENQEKALSAIITLINDGLSQEFQSKLLNEIKGIQKRVIDRFDNPKVRTINDKKVLKVIINLVKANLLTK